ncbi:MAG: crossover junction endodeoxyribonuclease RuvC [Candidatus Handelsmanbacteria bacterium RIFCSPLOWO2_12_FULL_64_10]|uniref:Crossover junction endodeoxyribonuclease RuvC n=1 Tax=Handelsmanbacteria sp. (strain RIFCSPLOWO2_12_FULL_64_10) TaxID=1817868 RepID=A0A1F6D7A7_HANXR|nr:MAG: crossover junction endodeoxyribonuclease RuvC [Candidatus Handelsmanbacteria bacterium RIFCSPLOWO2_12_FULL_64_10]
MPHAFFYPMRILGIDPGSVVTGYGLVESASRRSRLIDSGFIRPDPKLPFGKRLLQIYDDLLTLISDCAPDEVALESVFYGENVQTMMKMCHARGVILLAVVNSDLPLFEYTPAEVKRAVVGTGSASKAQVRFMVEQILDLSPSDNPDDTYDAVALALCHSHRRASGVPGSRRTNNLEDRLRQMGAYDRKNKLSEKLKALKVKT